MMTEDWFVVDSVSARINPAQGAFDGTACRMAAQIGVAYNSNEKCQLGAPFYAFSVTELVTFARAIAALPHPAPAGGDAGEA